MPNLVTSAKPLIEKVVRMIDYLARVAMLRTKVNRDVANYEEVVWISSIPHDKNCFTQAWGHSDEREVDEWLEVTARKEPKLPEVPSICKNWIDPETLTDTSKPPQLAAKTTLEVPNSDWSQESDAPKTIEKDAALSDHPEVQLAWDKYLESAWNPWAMRHDDWKKLHNVYSALFAIHQKQLRLGEEYELVLGLGLLTWITPTDEKVRRHLVVADAQLDFKASEGRFIVGPRADGSKLRIELDMLSLQFQPVGVEKAAMEGLMPAADNPWDKAHVEPVLKSLVHSINAEREYSSAMLATAAASRKAFVEYAPALILRKRSARGLTDTIEKIKELVESGVDVPEGFKDLAEVLSPDASESEAGGSGSSDEFAGEVYFPKPSNDEQRQIVQKLNRSRGVVVQGPPGTGKSHTIANLVCHLLATGQRVLVTAKTPRALQVLEEKIPQPLRPLCINLLGAGADERGSLESSVTGILQQNQQWQASLKQREKAALDEQLRNLRSEKADLDRKLREVREAETHSRSIAGGAYKGTAAHIAKQVNRDKHLYEWFKDQPQLDAELPVTPSDLDRALQALRYFTPAKRTEVLLLRANGIPDPSEFSALVSEESSAIAEERAIWPDADEQSAEILLRGEEAEVDELKDVIADFAMCLGAVATSPSKWMQDAVRDTLSNNATVWQTLRKSTADCVEVFTPLAAKADDTTIENPPGLKPENLRKDAGKLRAHLAGGGKLGWGPFRPTIVKDLLEVLKKVRVNGHPCRTADDFATLEETLKVRIGIEKTWQLWSGKCERTDGPLLLQLSALSGQRDALDSVLPLVGKLAKCKEKLRRFPALPEPDWNDLAGLDKLVASCRLAKARSRRIKIQAEIQSIAADVEKVVAQPKAHPENKQLLSAIGARNVEQYEATRKLFASLAKDAVNWDQLQEWMRYFGGLLPQLAEDLESTSDESHWTDRIKNLEKAWQWVQARHWIEDYIGKEDVVSLVKRVKQKEDRIHTTIGALAENCAWSYCFERLTESHRRHMEGWRLAMRRLGKGTGKHASANRREAQRNLEECREAVPAWIMPLHRVWDTIRPQPGMFDVIIVDEASQCGLEGLPLLFLAKKILIVGDDKQISPDNVGVALDEVHRLMEKFLDDFAHRGSFHIDSSLFDNAKQRYVKSCITLREHFRCMPEIIRFSNELCYSATPLIPLRQYGPDRLPPTKHIFVSGGYREGEGSRVINRPEAEAIVDKIEEMCGDPKNNGKSMGVVILQGEAQAALIEKMLLDRLGAESMEQRRLICGNPYTFQGDERDIVFLSMVAAPNARIGSMASPADERRFNVAASRARDMMILFHSVQPEDLSSTCLRRRLLEYFKGTLPQPGLAGLAKDELEIRAARDNRQIVEPPQPFDSWFELDVALELLRRSYRVRAQYEVAGKFIDLMVEGGKTRLAIECDGDRWHGADNYEADMERQRKLERCGEVFFRIREAAFYANKEEALRGLWDALEDRGIHPVSVQPSKDAEPEEESEDEQEIANAIPEEDLETMAGSGRRPDDVPAAEVQEMIVKALAKCPNMSCTEHSITSRVLKELGILTRGKPYADFERRVMRSVAVLAMRGQLERYKAKNKRLRLSR
jgi:very-short-patch-repair endonuclease